VRAGYRKLPVLTAVHVGIAKALQVRFGPGAIDERIEAAGDLRMLVDDVVRLRAIYLQVEQL
jgi:hypothetical protein